MKLHVKRVYEAYCSRDGKRVLVDRLWPRGLTKEAAKIDFWAKEVSPSSDLRRWYGHDPDRWLQFKKRYFVELRKNGPAVEELLARIGQGKATLVFGSKETQLNNAHALKEYLLALTGEAVI